MTQLGKAWGEVADQVWAGTKYLRTVSYNVDGVDFSFTNYNLTCILKDSAGKIIATIDVTKFGASDTGLELLLGATQMPKAGNYFYTLIATETGDTDNAFLLLTCKLSITENPRY